MRSWVIKTLCGAGEVVQQLKYWPLFQRTQVSFPAWDTAVYNPVTTGPEVPMSSRTSLGILRCQTFNDVHIHSRKHLFTCNNEYLKVCVWVCVLYTLPRSHTYPHILIISGVQNWLYKIDQHISQDPRGYRKSQKHTSEQPITTEQQQGSFHRPWPWLLLFL